MKKIIDSLLFSSFVTVNSLFSITFEGVEKFANGISNTIFHIAWPTAHYEDVEIVDYYSSYSKNIMILKFKGKSSICMIGSCPLWFKVKIIADDHYSIENMDVIEHNALIQEPFKTAGAITGIILELNRN